MLRATDVAVHYDGLKALDGVDLALGRGEVMGLMGPNGAGKTTLLNAITGFAKLVRGRVSLDDHDVTGWPPQGLARAGLSRTFQAVRPFVGLTVRENIEASAVASGTGAAELDEFVDSLLARFDIGEVAERTAGTLPYGYERRLALARALAAKPDYLLLDEPAAGLIENEKSDLAEDLLAINRDFGCAILIVEHDIDFVVHTCGWLQVLAEGKTLRIGEPAEVLADEAVKVAYLGTTH